MDNESPKAAGNERPSRFGRIVEKAGRAGERGVTIASKIMALAVLFLVLCWLIINSPIAKPVSFADMTGTLLATSTLMIILCSGASVVYWVLFRKRRGRRYLKQSLVAIAGVSLIFFLSLWLVTATSVQRPIFGVEFGGLLLGAASLALFVFSTLIAIAALVGWPNFAKYIKSSVQEAISAPLDSIHKSIDTTLKEIRDELRGRSLSYAGLQLGELSLGKDSLQVEREELFNSAVESCRRGFRELEHAATGPRLMALNNWLYYSTFQKKPLIELTENKALEYARELEEAGRANKAVHLQLTYGRVIARCISSLEERAKAKNLLNDLMPQLSASERREAQDCIRLLNFNDPRMT